MRSSHLQVQLAHPSDELLASDRIDAHAHARILKHERLERALKRRLLGCRRRLRGRQMRRRRQMVGDRAARVVAGRARAQREAASAFRSWPFAFTARPLGLLTLAARPSSRGVGGRGIIASQLGVRRTSMAVKKTGVGV